MLQRWIIVHSILYYIYNHSIVPDSKFDYNCRLLNKVKIKYPEQYKKSKFYYIFNEQFEKEYYKIPKLLNKEDKKRIKMIIRDLLNTKYV